MGYKLIALDIDGTIRNNDHPLARRTLDAVEAVRSRGAIVTLATGRMFRSALRSSVELGLDAPIASFQGAHIADPLTGEVLWHRPLEQHMTLEALQALSAWDLQTVAYHGEEVFITEMTPWAQGYGERNSVRLNLVGDLREVAHKEMTRLVVVGEGDEVRRLEIELKDEFDSRLHVTRSLPHFCEILHPEGGKHRALDWLRTYLGVDIADTIAFGNGYNDVDMLRWAGLGIAIGGAVPEVLAVADMVAPPVEEDGAAQALESLLDEGRIG